MTDRRVVVTGVGTVNASTVGGRDALASALALGRSAIGPVRAFDVADLTSRLAAEVDEATVASLVDRDAARRLSRICRLALGACLLAVRDAGVDGRPRARHRGRHRAWRLHLEPRLRAGLPASRAGRTLADDLPEHRDEHDGGDRGHRHRRQGALDHREPGDARRRSCGGPRGSPDRSTAARTRWWRVASTSCSRKSTATSPRWARSPPCRAGRPKGVAPSPPITTARCWVKAPRSWCWRSSRCAQARGARIIAEIVEAAWGNVPTAPHTARPGRVDRDSPAARLIRACADAGRRAVLRRRQRRSRGRRLGARAARP